MTEFESDTSTNRWKVSDVLQGFRDAILYVGSQNKRLVSENEGYESHR